MYIHLTRDDRAVISDGLRRGESYNDIGQRIGRNKGTVFKEVNRNKDLDGRYDARRANRRAKERREGSKRNERLLENDQFSADIVEALLHPLISPECIAHQLDIHHQTIYSWIYRSRPDLLKRLPYQGKKRRKYGHKRQEKQGWTKHVRPLSDKPENIATWEGDTIRGKDRNRLLTHVETASLYTVVHPLPDGTADGVQSVLKKEKCFEGTAVVYDRGSEFALWRMIEKDTGAITYFADPHSPWQRAKNENTNGRLRRVFQKKKPFAIIDKRELAETVSLMNHTPRKSLGWLTPTEVYLERCTSR